jgi:hypothetical protein
VNPIGIEDGLLDGFQVRSDLLERTAMIFPIASSTAAWPSVRGQSRKLAIARVHDNDSAPPLANAY